MSHDPVRPALLVSIHDVSPLTLGDAQRAVEVAQSMGVPDRALTLLAIPCHDDRVALDKHPASRDWLNRLADRGACVVIHGLTHRMRGATRHPTRWLWAHAFARGQGEFYLMPEADASQRISAAKAIFRRAGLERGATGFVPPAWLLSPGALNAVREAEFCFHEQLDGIVQRESGPRARRLIGFGSLTSVEARATVLHSQWQARRTPTDVRFAIHPVDMNLAVTTAAIRQGLKRLLDRLHPMNYTEYLGARAPTARCVRC